MNHQMFTYRYYDVMMMKEHTRCTLQQWLCIAPMKSASAQACGGRWRGDATQPATYNPAAW